MKNTKSFYIIFLIMVITACTPFGLLHKEQPRVTLALPARQETGPMNVVKRDSVSLPPVSNFTFVNYWDISKSNLITLLPERTRMKLLLSYKSAWEGTNENRDGEMLGW